MFRAASVILVLLLTAAASAQLSEVTPFVGFQTGGVVELDEENNDMNSAPAFGVMVTFDRGRGRLEAGFFRYLTKPIKVAQFMETLSAALDFVDKGAGAN